MTLATMVMAMATMAGVQTQPAHAPQAAPTAAVACPAKPLALTGPLAGWSRMRSINAAATVTGIGKAIVPLGSGLRATLAPVADVTFVIPPEKPAAPTSSGGMFGFTVTSSGRYRVAAGTGAWLDIVAAGQALPAVAHGHGPQCSGIRKMVDFDLKPGRYLLQVAGSDTPVMSFMIAKLRA